MKEIYLAKEQRARQAIDCSLKEAKHAEAGSLRSAAFDGIVPSSPADSLSEPFAPLRDIKLYNPLIWRN